MNRSGRKRIKPGTIIRYRVLPRVHGSTNGTNGIPISFKVLPMVIPLVPMVPLERPLVANIADNGSVRGSPNGTTGKIIIWKAQGVPQ